MYRLWTCTSTEALYEWSTWYVVAWSAGSIIGSGIIQGVPLNARHANRMYIKHVRLYSLQHAKRDQVAHLQLLAVLDI
jgi:hypothetical protein